jgi:hypothetical protein
VVIAGKKIDTPCYIWKNRTGMNLWNVVLPLAPELHEIDIYIPSIL